MFSTVQTIEKIIDEIAPFETAEAFDNVGLLVGNPDAPVTKILVALDATLGVVEEAKEIGAELILTHHPLLFQARKKLVENDIEGKILCEMIRNRISLISAHTNLDRTPFSGSAVCAKELGLQNIRQDGYIFWGEFSHPIPVPKLQSMVSDLIGTNIRCYGQGNDQISTLAIAGGSYSEGWEQAKSLGAQALLTGEVRHHHALSAAMAGFYLLDGGHYATEVPLVSNLAEYLQIRLNEVQYNVRVYPSKCAPFGSV